MYSQPHALEMFSSLCFSEFETIKINIKKELKKNMIFLHEFFELHSITATWNFLSAAQRER